MIVILFILVKLDVLENMAMEVKLFLIFTLGVRVENSNFSITRDNELISSVLVELCLVQIRAIVRVKLLRSIPYIPKDNLAYRGRNQYEFIARAEIQINRLVSMGL